MANNTQLVYRNALSAFSKFRAQYNLPELWPSPSNHIILFLTACFGNGYSPSTLASYCSGIGFLHKVNGLKDPTDEFVVRKLLEGCRRRRKVIDTRAPIGRSLLEKIVCLLPKVCRNSYETKLFLAAYTLAYFGLLRISELVYTSVSLADRPLMLSDICLSNSFLILTIRKSKTNQVGKPVKLKIPTYVNKQICCVNAAMHFLKCRPKHLGYLLCHEDKSPLTRYQFSAILARCIQQLGMPSQLYKTHSFRIGRATDLSLAGVSSENIKRLGRWTSDTYTKYIR